MFTVVTDHSAPQWVMSSTKTTGRLIRWALWLQKFDFVSLENKLLLTKNSQQRYKHTCWLHIDWQWSDKGQKTWGDKIGNTNDEDRCNW